MAVVTYCLLQTSTGLCVNKFTWDDTYTYTPATGFSLAPNDLGEINWTWNGSVWIPNAGTTPASPTAPVNNVLRSLDALQGSVVAGDTLYADDVNNFNRLPIGSAGQILSVSGGIPTWVAAPSSKPVILFLPSGNEPPSTNYATFNTRNLHPTLDFDTTTQESAIWTAVLPTAYAGGGLTVEVYWAAATATTGTIGWDVAIERIDASSLDIDADSFATAQTITASTVPGTSGQIKKTSVSITSGANMDSLAAGEAFRVRLRRDVANDTATGDAQMIALVVRET